MADDEGRLSLDQFAQEMTDEQEKATTGAADDATELETDLDAQGATEEEAGLETEEEVPEGDDETEEEEKPVVSAIAPPASWAKEDHDAWATLTPAAQLVVSRREADRDRAINIASSRAGQAEKQMQDYAEQLKAWVPQVAKTFRDRWDGFDWAGLARDNPLDYPQYREAYEAEQAQIAHAKREADKASEVAFSSFVKTEAEKLSTIAPELTDPAKGPERRKAAAEYAISNYGFTPDDVRNISAAELTILHKAKCWDDSQAQTKAAAIKVKTQPPAKPVPKAVSPVSGAPVSPQRALQGLNDRLTKKGGLDAFAALMTAEQEQGARKTVRR